MAIDFHEETYRKRYMAARLAYEAQASIISKYKPIPVIESPHKSESKKEFLEEE